MDLSLTYVPAARFRNGHAMTIWTWARRRHFPELPAPEPRIFDVDPRARVLAHCHWQPEPQRHPAVLVLHGLEGSSHAHYMCGLADKAFKRGFNVVRLNQRNCGGTEHLSETLYHSGLTGDAAAVIRELHERDGIDAFGLVGYSLGGNLAVKLAGEVGAEERAMVKAVCAVSPTMDLERCVRALERPSNVAYQWNFVRNLKARMRRKAVLMPERFSTGPLRRIHTVRQFDEMYTAPHFGFADASDYYHRASALRVVNRIRIPTLILAAEDDPFVPADTFSDPEVTGNPFVTVRLSRHGGHCGFLSAAQNGDDGYWAERAAVSFLAGRCEPIAAP